MPSESVKASAVSGLRWLAVKSVVGEVLGVTATVVLARLISPAQFGHAAVALLFNLLAVILTFEGFAAALVQRTQITERHREVAVLLSLVGGAALTALVLMLVPVVWRPVFGQETAQLILLSSPSFLVAGFGAVARAMLWRHLDFRRVTQVDLLSMLGGNSVSVAMAIMHFGATALVIGADAGVLISSVLMLAAAPEPLPRFHFIEAKEIVGYGTSSALANIFATMTGNIDYWIVAARLSAYQTGIYYRAFNLGVIYQSKISNVMMQLAFPVYSRLESRHEMRRLHERAVRIHAAGIFPVMTLLIVLAPVAIPFVFGSAWRGAVGPTQILAGAGMVAAILTGYSQVLQAVGRPQTLVGSNLAILITYGSAVAATVDHGLLAVAAAVVGVYLLILIWVYQFLLRPHLGLSLLSLVPELGPALVGSAAIVIIGLPVRMAAELYLPAPLTIVAVAATGICVYGATLRSIFPAAFHDLRSLAVRTVPQVERLRTPIRRNHKVAADMTR